MARRLLVILLVGSMLAGCGSRKSQSVAEPVGTPVVEPASALVTPGAVRGPVIYFAAERPALAMPSESPEVTRIVRLEDLKALTDAGPPMTIWLDARRVAEVEPEWLRGVYERRWPVLVLGTGSQPALLAALGVEGVPVPEAVAALRQKSLTGNDVQARWTELPDLAELVGLSKALLQAVGAQP